MDIERLKDDVCRGLISVDQLVELVARLQAENQELRRRIDELEKRLGGASAAKVSEPFSVQAEEKRQEARGKKRRKRNRPLWRGRLTMAAKIGMAVRTEKVFPEGVPQEECKLSHTRLIWRLENGHAVMVAYEVYRGPNNRYGRILGAMGRSEFGLEIVVAIAYQVYVVGLSFDKVCLMMNFFQGLQLRKSQVDALMHRLSRHWERQFDVLCTLLAHSAVVHADETSWSLNSAWVFLSEKVRLLFFGVHKDGETLKHILDWERFAGIVVSDDASVYGNFTKLQRCWAHLLRKSIKLTLQDPSNAEFRDFTDRLLEIYRRACRVQRDRRLSDAGRARKVGELDDEILRLCGSVWAAELPPTEGLQNDYRRLANELMRLMLARQLFTFVTAPPTTAPMGETAHVGGTNNAAERDLRPCAAARDTGRTDKSYLGARRRTIVVSVLGSLRQHLPTFTLSSVIEEVLHWCKTGMTCFERLLHGLHIDPPHVSVLDQVLPVPAG
jgi:hypothetical protein